MTVRTDFAGAAAAMALICLLSASRPAEAEGRAGVQPLTAAPIQEAARRVCRLNMRWSTYHRKCVLWLPIATG